MPQTYTCVPNGVPPTEYVNNTGAGTPDLDYPIGFPYIQTTDIIVFTGDTGSWTQRNQGTGTNEYQINPQGGLATDEVVFNNAVGGANILIWRRTDLCNMGRTFTAGSSIRAEDLNQDFTQLLYILQEAGALIDGIVDGGTPGGGLPLPGDQIDLDDLGDVEITSPANPSWLRWNGTQWEDRPILEDGDAWVADDNHVVTSARGDDRWLNSSGDIIGRDMITATESSGTISLDVDLAAVSGLESTNPGNAAGQLRVDDGNGIVVNSTGVNVGQGTGITVNADDVAVTSQTVWGQTHDHSAAVDGDMTNVGDITFEAGGGTLNGVANENIQIDGSGTGILDVDRNTDIDGTLDVSGAVDFDSTLNVDGNTTFGSSGSNTHEFDGDVTILRQGDLKFNGAATANAGSAEFIAPNQFFDSGGSTPTDFSYTLPSVAPPGDRVLQSDSSGVMSWVVGGGGGTGAIQNLSNSTTTGNVTVEISDGGTNTTIAAANTTRAGVMTSGMFDKLNGLPGSGTGVLNLEDLDDVTITSIADGQVIRWDATDSRWENQELFSGGAVLTFRGVVDTRTNNPTIAYGSIAAGDFWVHDDPSEADPADVVGTAQQDSSVPSGWTRVNNPGGGSETVNNTGLPVARGTMLVAGQSFTISGTAIINFVQLGTINAGTVTDVTASNGLTATDTGTTTNISMDTTGVTAGDYGSASQVPVLSVNDRGQITSASTANIPANTNTEYAISVEQTGGNNTDPNLRLTGDDGSTDNVTFEGGTNVTVTRVDANRISIAAAGGGSGTITEVTTNNGLTGGGTSGSVNVGIADNGVTFAKMQDMAANTILGNNTGSAADPKELSVSDAQTLLNITPGATTNTGTVTSVAGNNGLTGTVTTSGNIGIATNGVTTARIANDAVTADKLNATNQAANRVLSMNGSNDGMVWVAPATGFVLTTGDTMTGNLQMDGASVIADNGENVPNADGNWDIQNSNVWQVANGRTIEFPDNTAAPIPGQTGVFVCAGTVAGWTNANGGTWEHPGGTAQAGDANGAVIPFYVQTATNIILGTQTVGS